MEIETASTRFRSVLEWKVFGAPPARDFIWIDFILRRGRLFFFSLSSIQLLRRIRSVWSTAEKGIRASSLRLNTVQCYVQLKRYMM